MAPTKCKTCAKFLSPQEAARCRTCKTSYHRACVSLSLTSNIAPNWSCPECKGKERGQLRPDDLEKEESFDSTKDMSPNMSRWIGEEMRRILKEELRNEFQKMRADYQAEFQGLRDEILKLQVEREKLVERVSHLETELKVTSKVAGEVSQLKQQINERDQQLLNNEIEIANLPETNSENLTHIVKLVAAKLNVVLADYDVVNVSRVGARHLNATSAAGPVEARARTVVVRFARHDVRSEFLRCARVRRGADTSELGIPGPATKFYINERLTKVNRQLFRQARDAAKQHDWQYVWTRNGRILARRKSGEPAHTIRTELDVARIH